MTSTTTTGAGTAATQGEQRQAGDPIVPRPDIRQAALRSIGKSGRSWWVIVTTLGVIVVAGVVAWIFQLRDGLGAAGYNDRAFWAVYEADLVAFIGVSYGGAVVSAILRLTKASWRAPLTRIAEATALVTLPIGMLFIIPHLGSPEKIWELVWPPYWNLSSPILWDFFAVSTYLLATAVFFYLPLIPDVKVAISGDGVPPACAGLRYRLIRWLYATVGRSWDGTTGQRRILHGALGLVAIMIIPMAVSVHSVLSFAFSSSSRAGYLETILPVYFVIAALYTGVAIVIVAVVAFRRAYRLERWITKRHVVRLGFMMAALGAIYLYLTFTEYLIDGYSGTAGNAAWVHQIVAGRYWIPFWFYFVAAGVVPLLLIAIPRTRNVKGMTVASVLILFAMWVKRLVIVVPAATEPLVRSAITHGGAVSSGVAPASQGSPALGIGGGVAWGTYHFTWIPIAITVAATAAIPLLLMILFKIFPVMSVTELEEVAQLEGLEVDVDGVVRVLSGATSERPRAWRTGSGVPAARSGPPLHGSGSGAGLKRGRSDKQLQPESSRAPAREGAGTLSSPDAGSGAGGTTIGGDGE